MAKTVPNAAGARPGLVGLCFHVFGEDGAIQYQGRVVAQVGAEHYLVQYFDWILGQESTLAVVSLSEMTCSPKNSREPWMWQFYKNDAHMNEWYQQHADGLKRRATQAPRRAQ